MTATIPAPAPEAPVPTRQRRTFGAWLRIFVGMIVGAAIYLVLLLALATDDLTYMLRRSVRRPA